MFTRPAVLALAAAALVPAAAHADGLPVPVDGAQHGVTSADGSARFTVRHAHGATLVRRSSPAASLRLRGRWAIPVVALDGTAGGLSHDGATLALIRPRRGFPRARTPLAFVATGPMRVQRLVTLHGDFSFDALSPDGRTAYVIHYTSRRDPTHYEVRALDTASGRLAPDPIVDPHDEPDEMRGYPLARRTSPDGDWAYTLYQGSGSHPFVHALDTAHGRAVCIDLPATSGGYGPQRLRLSADGGTLTVMGTRHPYALIDTRTFAVRKPDAPHVTSAAQRAPAPRDDSSAWPAIPAAAAIVLAGAAAIGRARRRRRPLSSSA